MLNHSGKFKVFRQLSYHFVKSGAMIPFILFLFSLTYYYFYYDHGIIPNDEGHLLHFAERMYLGEVPGRDFHLETYIYGRYALLSFLFHIFGGPNILIERAMWLVLRALCVVMAFLIGRRIMPTSYAITATLFLMIVPGPWHKTPYAFSCLLGLLSLYYFLDKRNRFWLALCGLAGGVCLQLRQDIGLIVIFVSSLILFLVSKKETVNITEKKRLLLWVGKGSKGLFFYILFVLAALAPAALYLLYHNALDSVFEQCFIEKFEQHLGLFNFTFRLGRMWERGDYIGCVYFAIPPVVFIVIVLVLGNRVLLHREKSERFFELLALFLIALLSINQAYNHLLIVRLLQCGPPVYLLLAFIFWRVAKRLQHYIGQNLRLTETWLNLGIPALLGLVFCIGAVEIMTSERESNLGVEYRGSIATYDSANIQINSHRASVWVEPNKAKLINKTMFALQSLTTSDDYIYVACNDSILYFVAERKNPTRFGKFIMPGESETRKHQVTKEIMESSVRFVVSTSLIIPGEGSKMESIHPHHPAVKLLLQPIKYKRLKIDTGYQKAYIILKRLN